MEKLYPPHVSQLGSTCPTRRQNAPGEPFLVTVHDAERLLSCGRTTIYKLISDGKLETVKIGRATGITQQSIRALAGAPA